MDDVTLEWWTIIFFTKFCVLKRSAIKHVFSVVHRTSKNNFLNFHPKVLCKEIDWQVSYYFCAARSSYECHTHELGKTGENFLDIVNKIKWQTGYSSLLKPRIMILTLILWLPSKLWETLSFSCFEISVNNDECHLIMHTGVYYKCKDKSVFQSCRPLAIKK